MGRGYPSTPRPFIPVPNAASVEMIYTQYTEVMENVFHVYKSSPFSLSDLQALRGVVNTWDANYWSQTRTGVASLYRIRCKALDAHDSPFEDYYLPTPRAGSAGGSTVPMGTAFCLKLASDSIGRSQRGRWYHFAFAFSNLTDTGNVALASATTWVTYLTNLKTALATAGYTLCVVSYQQDKEWRAVGKKTDITSIVAVDLHLDSMRKRLPGRGHLI